MPVRGWACIWLLCLTAGGCVNLKAATPPPVIAAPRPKCPPKVDYTQAQLDALEQAVKSLPPNSPIIGYLTDYHDMRVKDDACLSAK